MNFALRALLAISIPIAAPILAQAAQGQATPAQDVVPIVDHHMHIFSPESSKVLDTICKALGPEGCPPQVSHAPSTGVDAIRALDAAGIKRGVLLSSAYFFTSPELAHPGPDVAGQTRAENTFIVVQAQASCGRLVPFISVNPTAANALDEIRYWGRQGGAAGLKLHLGSAKFDFRDPRQAEKLAAVFEAAGEAHLAIVMHMQTRSPDYGADDVRIFLQKIYPRSGNVPVQIAHAAGGGGINPGQLAALRTFAAAIQRDPRGTRRLHFDLAMVPDLFANEGKVAAKPGDVEALESLMHQIGLNRFLLASDYTDGLDLRAYYANEKAALALSAPEWHQLATNVAPYIPRKETCAR
jgi:predicted TIM-barrel fold metal-dependent hydrolase